MILQKHKNALLTIIQESDLDPKLFVAEDSTLNKEKFFIIRLRNSPLLYAIRPYERSFSYFESLGSRFVAGFPLEGSGISFGTQPLFDIFKSWLNNVVKPYLDELSTPDLWQALQDTRSEPIRQIESPLDLEPFSEKEKIQLKRSIDELRLSIENNFNLQKKELAATNKLLQHLSDAVDKHNKFDWRGIAINIAFTIATNLALNPEQSRQLFQLFKETFTNIIHLLP